MLAAFHWQFMTNPRNKI